MMAKSAVARRAVVLDGSNIVSGGHRDTEQKPNGNRLVSAINLYRSNGYDVYPCIKGSTFFFMSGEKLIDYGDPEKGKHPKSLGYDALNKLTERNSSPRLRTFKWDDDMHIINLALEKNAWIVTNDTFEDSWDHNKQEPKKRERTNYPHLDWDEIDDMTWGTSRHAHKDRVIADDTWRTEDDSFLHPTLKPAPVPLISDEYANLRKATASLGGALQDIERLTENHSDSGGPNFMESISKQIYWMSERYRKIEDLIPDPQMPSEEELGAKTVVELREICDMFSLKKSGRKKDIIERILESQKSVEAPVEKEPKEKGTKECGKIVTENLKKTPPRNRPKKKAALLKHIEVMRNERWGEERNVLIVNWLVQKKKIRIKDNGEIIYSL